MWSYPLPAWVKPGAPVRCALPLKLPLDYPGEELEVKEGDSGRVMSVDDANVRVYIGPILIPVPGAKTPPEWDGAGAPKEPYAYVDHMRGDFDGIWVDARN